MTNIEIRKWLLEWITAQAHEEHMKVHENIMNKLNIPSVEEQPTRKAGVKILSRSISKDCSYRYEDETDEEFKERIERNHELGLENPKTCQPGDHKYNEVGFFVYYGDKNTPAEDVGKGCSPENNMLGVAIDKSQHYYDYDEDGKMTIKAFKPELKEDKWGKFTASTLYDDLGSAFNMIDCRRISLEALMDNQISEKDKCEILKYVPSWIKLGFDPILLASVDEFIANVDMTPRLKNALKSCHHSEIDDLFHDRFNYLFEVVIEVVLSKEQENHIPSIDRKSLQEFKEILSSFSLKLTMDPPLIPENIEQLRELYKKEIEARLKNE